uniref:RING-type E3 ubiquitin transferase n=3 Tax=Culex pipiens TaxID=7175 RepID=A0A8D8IGH7_CULPI
MSSKLLNYPAATSNPHLASGTGPSSGGSSAPGNATVAGQLNLENLQLDDILCTVCQSVLVEPVFLPCQHRFCRNCLSGTIEKNNLNCPCCRKRFGTWYRNASRVNKLVHEQLWSAIQRQFREYLEEDGGAPGRCNGNGGTGGGNGIVTSCFVPPTESVIHLSEPGEIRKEYENELQRYRKELIEEKKKELAASEKYIINLYKQEGIIDLVDSSDHLSISSSTSTPEPPDQDKVKAKDDKANKGGADVHQVVDDDDDEEAGPSGSFPIRNGTISNATAAAAAATTAGTSNNQKPAAIAANAVASRPGTSKSGSIISISSTSTASGASSSCISSASSRYSLSKVDKAGQKGATVLGKQPAGGAVKKVFTMAEVNKSELCVKPTKIHRRTSSQAAGGEGGGDDDDDVDDGDSLRSELNHFKPILATTPKSCFSPKAIVRVPSVRPEAGTLPTSSSKANSAAGPSSPTKSPFKPIDPTTPRRSAFSVVNMHLFTPLTTSVVGPSKKQPEAVASSAKKSGSKKRSSAKKGSSSKKKSKSTPALSGNRKRKLKFSPTSTKVAKAKSSPVKPAAEDSAPRVTRRSVNKEANRLKELIVNDQQRREAMIEQERRDFEFAQKLQKKFNRTRGATGVTMAPEVIAKELLKQAQASIPPPRRHSISYSLRRRPSVMEIPTAPVVVEPSTSFAVPEPPTTSRKRKTMAAPPSLPPSPPPPPQPANRKKPTKAATAARVPIKVEPEVAPPPKILRRSTRNRN